MLVRGARVTVATAFARARGSEMAAPVAAVVAAPAAGAGVSTTAIEAGAAVDAGGLRAIVAPSMLSSDFARLADEAKRMTDLGADWLHMDVMDGHFVPNLTLGAPIVKALRKHTKAFIDCHLMVSEPEKWVDDFGDAGVDNFTFHIEATRDAGALIDRIIARGMRASIAIKPSTPLDALLPLAGRLFMVLVMTVEPGFGGQAFMPSTMEKVRALRAAYPHLNIEVDGGIAESTVDTATAAGANVIVAGTGIFKAPSPGGAIAALRASVARHIGDKPLA